MTILPKGIYRCNAIPIKIPVAIFAKTEKPILKFLQNFKGPHSQNNLEKEKQIEGLTPPHFKTYYKARVIKTVVLA